MKSKHTSSDILQTHLTVYLFTIDYLLTIMTVVIGESTQCDNAIQCNTVCVVLKKMFFCIGGKESILTTAFCLFHSNLFLYQWDHTMCRETKRYT